MKPSRFLCFSGGPPGRDTGEPPRLTMRQIRSLAYCASQSRPTNWNCSIVPRLVIHHAGQDSRVLELSSDRPVSIGRAKSSTLVLNDPSVSRVHAIVRATGDNKWEINDRASANGVKINGVAVKEAILKANDEVVLGAYHLRFEDSSARKVMTYGTTELPERVAQALNQPARYTGLSLAVESVAGASAHDMTVSPDAYAGAGAPAGQRPADHENRLLALLNRVNRTLSEMTSLDAVIERSLDLVLEIDGTERAYAMLLDEVTLARGDLQKRGYS